jgi:hypothetical protein
LDTKGLIGAIPGFNVVGKLFFWENSIKGALTMPVPQAILDQGNNYHKTNVITIEFDAPRAGQGAGAAPRHLAKRFHCYVELYFQAKHSNLIRGYCDSKKIARRNDTGEMCVEGQTAEVALGASGFYAARSRTAADIVYHDMRRKWAGPQGPGSIIGAGRHDCGVQKHIQADGFQYEVSYYYNGEAYLFYHVYPPR